MPKKQCGSVKFAAPAQTSPVLSYNPGTKLLSFTWTNANPSEWSVLTYLAGVLENSIGDATLSAGQRSFVPNDVTDNRPFTFSVIGDDGNGNATTGESNRITLSVGQ